MNEHGTSDYSEQESTPSKPKPRLNFDNIYTYHAPKPGQAERYTAIRAKAKELAELIHENSPESREQSLAYTNLEQAIFWANAAIARNE